MDGTTSVSARSTCIASRLFRPYLLVFLALATSFSCSMRKFVLDQHEFFSTQLAAMYLDLNHEQKDRFRTQWHRFSTGIAKSNAETIAKAIESLGESTDPTAISDDLQRLLRQTLRSACTDFSVVAAGLKSAQLQHLQEKIAARNKNFDPAHHGGLDKYRSHRRKEFLENLDRWLGNANEAQKKLISDMYQNKEPSGQWEKDYLNYSREAQGLFMMMIQNSSGDAQIFEKKCIDFVKDSDAFLTEDSRRTKSKLNIARQYALSSVFQTIDPNQRQHLRKETSKLARELREWARDNSTF